MRRRIFTKRDALDAGFEVLGHASPVAALVFVKWDRRAQRRWSKLRHLRRGLRLGEAWALIRTGAETPITREQRRAVNRFFSPKCALARRGFATVNERRADKGLPPLSREEIDRFTRLVSGDPVVYPTKKED